jgi:hypothetical protein
MNAGYFLTSWGTVYEGVSNINEAAEHHPYPNIMWCLHEQTLNPHVAPQSVSWSQHGLGDNDGWCVIDRLMPRVVADNNRLQCHGHVTPRKVPIMPSSDCCVHGNTHDSKWCAVCVKSAMRGKQFRCRLWQSHRTVSLCLKGAQSLDTFVTLYFRVKTLV